MSEGINKIYMERSRPRLRRENLDSGDHSILSNSEIFESSFPQMLLIHERSSSFLKRTGYCYLLTALLKCNGALSKDLWPLDPFRKRPDARHFVCWE